MMKRILFSIFLSLLFSVNLSAQNRLLQELIDLPAPPQIAKMNDENDDKHARSEEFYDKKNVPLDDAPIEDVLDFWARQNFITEVHLNKIKPSEKILARLIESAKENAENLPNILTLIPNDEKNSALVKDIYDTQNASFDENQNKKIKEWLKYKTPYFSDELLTEAQTAKDHKTYKTIGKETELRALAKVDWEKAEPILNRFKDDRSNPRTALFAKTLIYEHAIETKDSATIEKYQNEFKEIVANKSASGYERDDALQALIQKDDNQNLDDWYLSLFEDETLLELNLGERAISNPLDSIVQQNPDKWIPRIVKLVGNKNRAVHNSAVQSLIQFQNQTARRDALEPLLPWLSNPDWTDVDDRLRLIQSMGFIDIPESVPGLIWLIENEVDDDAADALVKYKDSRAIPALKNALVKTADERSRKSFIEALIACNGLAGSEMLEAIEKYAQSILTLEGYKKVEERDQWDDENPLPLLVSIGSFLSKQKEPQESFVQLLLERQKILQKENPQVAKILSGIMAKWQGRLVDLEMLGRIEDGAADVETILGALERRKELRERVLNDLYLLRGKSGLAGAFAACLIEDDNDITSAFNSKDVETQIGTLACARLLRKPLSVSDVGALLDSPNKLLALAAERYLESEDSPEARQLVLAKHPNQALILGARTSFNPAKVSMNDDYNSPLGRLFSSVSRTFTFSSEFGELEKAEEKLRREIIENSELTAVYAHLPNYETGQRILRIYKDRATFTYSTDKARYRETEVSKEELEKFFKSLSEIKIDEFTPKYVSCHHNCYTREFISLNRHGGRRIFAGSGFGALGILDELENFFDLKNAKTNYYLSGKIKGLELVFADKNFQPQAIWKNGNDFRILVSDEERKAQIEEEISKLDKIDDENEDLDYEIRGKNARQRRIERALEHYEWREFRDGKLGANVEEPAEVPFLRDKLTFPQVDKLQDNDSIWQSRSGNFEIRAGEYSEGGLWKTNRSQTVKFKDGLYSNPIVSGNWVIAAKAEENWSPPNNVVRINLQTGKEVKINLPSAEEFYPFAFVAAHNKVLLYRAKEAYSTLNPTAAEYYLLDANTGKTELIKGEFHPLMTQDFRTLQPTGKPYEFWATVYSRLKNETGFGIYNTQNFTFKPFMKLPEIVLSSTEIWVDEKAAKIYFIYGDSFGSETHLLSLPFPKTN